MKVEKAPVTFGSTFCKRCRKQRHIYKVEGVGWRCSFGHTVKLKVAA